MNHPDSYRGRENAAGEVRVAGDALVAAKRARRRAMQERTVTFHFSSSESEVSVIESETSDSELEHSDSNTESSSSITETSSPHIRDSMNSTEDSMKIMEISVFRLRDWKDSIHQRMIEFHFSANFIEKCSCGERRCKGARRVDGE